MFVAVRLARWSDWVFRNLEVPTDQPTGSHVRPVAIPSRHLRPIEQRHHMLRLGEEEPAFDQEAEGDEDGRQEHRQDGPGAAG